MSLECIPKAWYPPYPWTVFPIFSEIKHLLLEERCSYWIQEVAKVVTVIVSQLKLAPASFW